MRRFAPTIMAGIIMLAFVAGGIWGAHALIREPELVFEVTGEYRLTAHVASDYTLWYTPAASVGGVYQVADPVLPVGTRIEVTHGGVLVPTVPDASTHMEDSEGKRASVLRFSATAPGEYVIKVSGFTGARHFEVTRGSALGAFFTVFGAVGAAMASATLVLLLFILALTGIWPKKKPAEPPVLSP